MNLIKFLESFTDDALYTPGTSRRESFSKFGNIGKGLAFAAVPFGLAAMSNKANAADIGPTPATAAGALQLALTLEYLESDFYTKGVASGIIPADDLAAITLIRNHETSHVNFLKAAMTANNVPIPAVPTFDYSAGIGLSPFTNYEQFLAVAQAFEDTGVRAYKGQAGYLQGTPFLTPALQIHSVEARHASQIRRMRGQKGWITLNEFDAGIPAAIGGPVYGGEQSTALGAGQFTAAAQSEAYDEVISTQTAVTIANVFIV